MININRLHKIFYISLSLLLFFNLSIPSANAQKSVSQATSLQECYRSCPQRQNLKQFGATRQGKALDLCHQFCKDKFNSQTKSR